MRSGDQAPHHQSQVLQEAEAGGLCKSGASLIYLVSSRSARPIYYVPVYRESWGREVEGRIELQKGRREKTCCAELYNLTYCVSLFLPLADDNGKVYIYFSFFGN